MGPRELRANLSTFLLDRSKGVLFVGARDAILAVDTSNMNQPPKMVRTVVFNVGRDGKQRDILTPPPLLLSSQIVWDVPEKKRQSCVTKGKTEVRFTSST